MNGHGIKQKLTINEKVNIFQEVERNPTVLRNEIVKCFALPLSSLGNILLWKASTVEEESWCGAHSKGEGRSTLLNGQGSVLYY
jgi:hypothetical protein